MGLGILGPVQNIQSSLNNCTSVVVTWNCEDDDRTSVLYYYLRIYDDITGSLMDTVSVYNRSTSYQFLNDNIFSHRYTYVITGVNEVGEGISNNDTFSYIRGRYTLYIIIALL